jgi:hypothetical protein
MVATLRPHTGSISVHVSSKRGRAAPQICPNAAKPRPQFRQRTLFVATVLLGRVTAPLGVQDGLLSIPALPSYCSLDKAVAHTYQLQLPTQTCWCKKGACNAYIPPKSEPCGFQWANIQEMPPNFWTSISMKNDTPSNPLVGSCCMPMLRRAE